MCILKIEAVLLLTALLLSGCVGHFAMASKLNAISPGMSKSEVTGILGTPERTAGGLGYEDITYILNESAWDSKMPEPYVIRLVGGRVERFGTKKEMELFYAGADSRKNSMKPDLYAEILKLDDLRKKGLITDAEYAAQKTKLLEGN